MARNRYEKPAAVVVVNRNDAGVIESITLNGDNMPAESVIHALRYGVTQWCQDGGAGAADQAAYTEGFADRLNRLLTGEIGRAKGEGREAADPIGNAAKALARDAFRKVLAANGATDAYKALSKEQKAETFAAFFADGEEDFRAEAERAAKAIGKNADKAQTFLAGLMAKAGGNG